MWLAAERGCRGGDADKFSFCLRRPMPICRADIPAMTSRPPIVFRCNASALVGLGHLMRCRELARALTGAGHPCAILGPDDSLRQPGDARLFAQWHPVPERGTSAQDAARLLALCQGFGARHLVMDDYRINPEYQLVLKGAGLRWLQQFDASKPWDFYADVLVNAGPYEQRSHYLRWLKNPAIITLLGPRYAVLRPAFANLPPRQDGRQVRRILVSFGGGDDRGAISITLQALAGHLAPGITLVIVSGGSNPRNDALRARMAALPQGQAELHIDPPDVAPLLAGCDLAIIAGGTMSYEAAICGLPMVFVPLVSNQTRSCQGWAEVAGAEVAGTPDSLTPEHLRAVVAALIADGPRRAAMASRGRALVDGNGTMRLLDALLEREPAWP